ncbi:hypothetical protein OEZ85_011513 [Tetradesmus obliquus]|uniref:Nuclear transcription factor Y subunit n=1 Tax=Tetradesmus obliquus TaxID=3088 RepID=A0ABY8TQK9_TETOB|nr:hypothetical protein OEZ85_011513 [Tetradesmus obliquus]
MLAGPLGGAEDAGSVPVQGVLVGGASAAEQQREYALYKTQRQWASHRRKVEAAAAADAARNRRGRDANGSRKWRQREAWGEVPSAETAAGADSGGGSGGAEAANSKGWRWQQQSAAAPAEEQGPLAGSEPAGRLPGSASPAMQLPVSHPAPSADQATHTAHEAPARHHKHQQAHGERAGGAAQSAMLPHHADAGSAAPHASSRAADHSSRVDAGAPAGGAARVGGAWEGGGYSSGADAAAQSLMRQWQALPGPLEMGGEMPLSR